MLSQTFLSEIQCRKTFICNFFGIMCIFSSVQPKSISLLFFILSRSNRILVSSYFQYSPVEWDSFSHIREQFQAFGQSYEQTCQCCYSQENVGVYYQETAYFYESFPYIVSFHTQKSNFFECPRPSDALCIHSCGESAQIESILGVFINATVHLRVASSNTPATRWAAKRLCPVFGFVEGLNLSGVQWSVNGDRQ